MRRAPRKPSVCVVGAGAVGTALAVALNRRGFRVTCVVDRTRSQARRLAARVRRCTFHASVSELAFIPPIVFLALPEEEIPQIVSELSTFGRTAFRKTTVLHVSGSLTSDVLRPLAKLGAAIGSLHPIVSFPRRLAPVLLADRLTGATFGFEGNASAERTARSLVRRLRGRCIRVPKEEKILYHITCVMFSNYAVVLIDEGAKLVKRLRGFHPADFRRLTEESIATTFDLGARTALTGPVARGSMKTLLAHRRTLKRVAPDVDGLYRFMGALAVDLAATSKRLPASRIAKMRKLFRTN